VTPFPYMQELAKTKGGEQQLLECLVAAAMHRTSPVAEAAASCPVAVHLWLSHFQLQQLTVTLFAAAACIAACRLWQCWHGQG
jgi:hypothetical protein